MAVFVWLISTIVIFGVFAKFSKIYNRIYVLSVTLFLFILTGWRSFSIGTDTMSYVRAFIPIGSVSKLPNIFDLVGMMQARFEYGYVYLDAMIYHFTNNPRWLLIVMALIVYIILAIFTSKMTADSQMTFIMFVTLGFFANGMNLIRQSVAVAVIMLAYMALLKGKNKTFFFTVFIAVLFHKTAILFLFVYLLKSLKFNLRNVLIIFFMTFLIAFGYGKIQGVLGDISYSDYSSFSAASGYLGLFLNIIIQILFLIVCFIGWKNRNEKKWSQIFSKVESNLLPFLMLITIATYVVAFNFSQLSRVSAYFQIASLIFVPGSIRSIESPKIKFWLKLIVYLVLITYFFVVLIYRSNWTNITPFSFG